MLTHPTLDQLRALKLDGMVQAFIELEAQEETRNLAHAEWLAFLQDQIFEGLPNGESAKWHVQLAETLHALPDDYDWLVVGVAIPAARLRQISAGARVGEDELTDVSFAVTATEIERQERQAKLRRNKQQLIRWLIVAGLVLLLLNSLVCLAYLFLSMTVSTYPY